jgi:hypothetical protein
LSARVGSRIAAGHVLRCELGYVRAEERRRVGLFTVNFELGEKTLATLREIASKSIVRFELGPETRR